MSQVKSQSRSPSSPQPENILCVNTTGHLVKIIDFGLARRYHLGEWDLWGEPRVDWMWGGWTVPESQLGAVP